MYVYASLRRWFCLGLVLLAAAGCESARSGSSMADRPARRPGDFASRRVPDTTIETVRPVAAEVFRSSFRIDTDRSTGDMFVSRPAEATDKVRAERVRDVLGRPNRHRRIALLRLSQDGSSVLVQCQVRLERLDTAEQAAFARERGDDRPTDTPIDRLGADAPKARQEWVYVQRDRQAEAQVLEAIVRQFAATQPSGR